MFPSSDEAKTHRVEGGASIALWKNTGAVFFLYIYFKVIKKKGKLLKLNKSVFPSTLQPQTLQRTGKLWLKDVYILYMDHLKIL